MNGFLQKTKDFQEFWLKTGEVCPKFENRVHCKYLKVV